MTPALQALLDDLTAEAHTPIPPRRDDNNADLIAARRRDAIHECFGEWASVVDPPLAVVVPLVREAS